MEKVNIQLIRDASLKLNYAGKIILVDPMLSAKESFMSFVQPDKNLNPIIDLPISAEDVIDGVDAVLLTHAHPDHLDPKVIEILPKNIPFFAQVADKEALSKTPFQKMNFRKHSGCNKIYFLCSLISIITVYEFIGLKSS